MEAWEHIEALAARISAEFPDAVFIGGVAVYYHAQHLGPAFAETSHDADFCLSIAGKAEMRDRYEMVRNERLGKDSLILEGEDLDVYVEHQNRLAVPYAAIRGYAQEIKGVRVAALEHLLALKLDAAIDRQGTAKGDKDLRDLIRITALLASPRRELVEPYLSDERLHVLRLIERRAALYTDMGFNAHQASRVQRTVSDNIAVIGAFRNAHEPIDGF